MCYVTSEKDSQGYVWQLRGKELWYYDSIDRRWYHAHWTTLGKRMKWLMVEKHLITGKRLIADAMILARLLFKQTGHWRWQEYV